MPTVGPAVEKKLTEMHALCERILSGEIMQISAVPIDGYRSSVDVKLENLEMSIGSPRLSGKIIQEKVTYVVSFCG